jgi:hypothetical protein
MQGLLWSSAAEQMWGGVHRRTHVFRARRRMACSGRHSFVCGDAESVYRLSPITILTCPLLATARACSNSVSQ